MFIVADYAALKISIIKGATLLGAYSFLNSTFVAPLMTLTFDNTDTNMLRVCPFIVYCATEFEIVFLDHVFLPFLILQPNEISAKYVFYGS